MMRFTTLLIAMLLSTAATAGERLSLATWNLEWMMTPQTFDSLAPHCLYKGQRAGGSERQIPCDIVPDKRWGAEDLARLRGFASRVTVDVIALQETDGAEAAAQVMPDRHFCFTKRHHVQNVGFAIRRGIPYRCNADYRALGLPENDVRWGADLTLYPGTPREIRLLSIHLKSACNRDLLSISRPECRTLQRQVPVLEDWIDRRARAGVPFAVLGDFNRRFDNEKGPALNAFGRIAEMWPEIDDGEPAEADLLDAGAEAGRISCNNGERVLWPIDHLVLGRKLARRMVPGSFKVWRYDGGRQRLPDHCLMSVELDLEPQNGL